MSDNPSYVPTRGSPAGFGRIAAVGSIVAALLTASCCVVPLVLVTLGVSGAWIGSLTAMAPYKPWFAVSTFGLLGYGFWHVYRRPEPAGCEPDSYCAKPISKRITQTSLWVALLLVFVALTVDFWAPLFY